MSTLVKDAQVKHQKNYDDKSKNSKKNSLRFTISEKGKQKYVQE